MAPTPRADPAERFRALRSHPEFERLSHAVPPLARERVSALRGIAGAVAFLVLGGALILPASVLPPVAIALAALLAFAFVFLVASAVKSARLGRGEIARIPARVVDERIGMSGGAAARVRTRYYVRLESERGTREEYEVDERLAGKVAPGDVGVAFFQGASLVDFTRVPV